MGAAEQTKEVVELAVGYTKQIVEALTPIAKQAYDVGLLTLRIDAAGELAIAALLLIIVVVGFICAYKRLKMAAASTEDIAFSFMFLTIPAGLVLGIGGVWKLFYIWAWVKLFSPELWLAHQAVEKLLK